MKSCMKEAGNDEMKLLNIPYYLINRVLYFSIHRYEFGKFWPNLRESDYDFIGEGKGVGYNINVPLNQVRMLV